MRKQFMNYRVTNLFKLVCMLFCFMLFSEHEKSVSANEETSATQNFIFIIDKSTTMQTPAKQESVIKIVEFYIDLCAGTENKIGYVVYNDEVITTVPLQKVVTSTEKEKFMAPLTKDVGNGGTDLSVGMNEALKMAQQEVEQNPTSETCIILLNDGEILNLGEYSKRTPEQFEADLTTATNAFKEMGISVYSISFNEQQINTNQTLETITEQTNGEQFIAYNDLDLLSIALKIYAKEMGWILDDVKSYTATDQEQPISIEIPYDGFEQYYFVALSSNSVAVEVENETNTIMSSGSNYALLEFSAPEAGTYNLSITAVPGDVVKVYTLSYDQNPPAPPAPMPPPPTFWEQYKYDVIAVAVIILGIGIVAAIISRHNKNKPVIVKGARIEGYFLQTKADVDIPVQFWPLSVFGNKRQMSLLELFELSEVNVDLPESKNIFFEIKGVNTIIFHHKTECLIEQRSVRIPKNKKIELTFNDRLYIVFTDQVSEIEIRFRKVHNT